MKKEAIEYLRSKAEMDKNAALMAFQLLLNKSVGIGDHSTGDYEGNLDEALNKLVDARDRLEMIEWVENNV